MLAIHRATIGKRLRIMPLSRWNQRLLGNGAGIASPIIGSAKARDTGDTAMIHAPSRSQCVSSALPQASASATKLTSIRFLSEKCNCS